MLRRLALLAALLGPVVASAQVAQVLIVPAAFGSPDCVDSTNRVTISWTSSVTFVVGDKYKIYLNHVSDASTCPASADASGYLAETMTATSQNMTLSTLTRSQFILNSGASCAAGAADSTIYVCVQHVDSTEKLFRANLSGSAPLNLKPPPIPEGVTVSPGDSSLYVSWVDGPSNGVAAATYEVTAETYPVAGVYPTRTQSFTGKVNNKVTGLTNSVEYKVTVRALAAGSSSSDPSLPAFGTPQPTSSFWDQYEADKAYQKAGKGYEEGGCGGGPAGLVSLLGVALVLRRLRRRS